MHAYHCFTYGLQKANNEKKTGHIITTYKKKVDYINVYPFHVNVW